jgi:hypothetical protein
LRTVDPILSKLSPTLINSARCDVASFASSLNAEFTTENIRNFLVVHELWGHSNPDIAKHWQIYLEQMNYWEKTTKRFKRSMLNSMIEQQRKEKVQTDRKYFRMLESRQSE